MSINVNIELLPKSIQRMAESVQVDALAYQEMQRQFSEAVAETKRLITAAEALEAEAEKANQQWKQLAMEPHADQRKINGMIERSVKGKGDAAALRRTAEVREQLHEQLIMKMAPARFELVRKVGGLNSSYCKSRLAELLESEGWAETVGEILRLSSNLHTAEWATFEKFERVADPLGPTSAGGYKQASLLNFMSIIMSKIERSADAAKTTVASMPAAVTGEVVVLNRIALRKLVANGGKIPDQISQYGGNYGPETGFKLTP